MSASLGGLLKDYRLQKNISQLEISFAIGWKEPSRLSRIEQGHVEKPKRELLERIMDAMKLSEEERNELLLAGSYLPTNEEIKKVRKRIGPMVENWPYPAVTTDFTGRTVYMNKKLFKFYNILPKKQKEIQDKKPWIIEIVFHPDFILNKTRTREEEKERREFLLRMLKRFQYAQKSRTKESWYQDLVKRMMNNELFRELWQKASKQGANEIDVTNFSDKYTMSTDNKKLHTYFFIVPVFKDPRFTIEFHTPADQETFKYFGK